MKTPRVLFLLSAFLLAAAPAKAENYPSKPIRIVVGYSAGGSSDLIARILAEQLSRTFKQPVIVENKAGATGQIATKFVAMAPADGYTLLATNIAPAAIAPALNAKAGYLPADFAAIAQTTVSPMLVTAPAAGKYKTFHDLLAAARSKPGSLNFASTGAGSLGHIANELILRSAQIQVGHIPYKSGGEVMTAMLGGQVDYTIGGYPDAIPLVKGGKSIALAVTSGKRVPALPEVPTLTEAGIKGADIEYWTGIVAPKGTPAAVVQALNKAVREALAHEDVAAKLQQIGLTPTQTSPAQFQAIIDADYKRYSTFSGVISITP